MADRGGLGFSKKEIRRIAKNLELRAKQTRIREEMRRRVALHRSEQHQQHGQSPAAVHVRAEDKRNGTEAIRSADGLNARVYVSAGVSEGMREKSPELTVWLYDYAGARPQLIERSRRQATEILENAGVRTAWEQCRTSKAEANQDGSCTKRASAHVIQLRIHPREMVKKLSKKGVEFGYSLPSAKGHGIIAGVFLERTTQMAKSLGLDAHVVLGHTMAHEIGHLLLGSNSHAKKGIMRPVWRKREIHLAKTGAFGFTDDQAERMQAQVAERLGR